MGSARQAENPHAHTQIKWAKLKHKEEHGVADQTVESKNRMRGANEQQKIRLMVKMKDDDRGGRLR